ncbi:MAG: hypothetical protein MJZ86_10215 [Bacteroidales bacterium]|nr:hypothetical protein [Bacteroidales bacterium]
MKRIVALSLTFWAILLFSACGGTRNMAERLVPGHYSYEHGWEYDTPDGHVSVHEVGTMDFYAEGTALDMALQVYTVTRPDKSTAVIVFKYNSPSCWHVVGDGFYFSGIEKSFNMEVETVRTDDVVWADNFARRTIESVRSTIGRETRFHLADITKQRLVWSYTYPNGHTDTWEFHRVP